MTHLIFVVIIILAMFAMVYKLIKKDSIGGKILIVNIFGTLTLIFLVLLSLEYKDAMLLDIAIIYALVNFITTLAFLKYQRDGAL